MRTLLGRYWGDIGGVLANHLCYADDICLISLSSAVMQQLLNMCETYANEHDLLYNGSKYYCLCFKPKCFIFNRPVYKQISLLYRQNTIGIIINENNCALDLKRQMCKLYANVYMIIRKFSKCSPDVKYLFFESYCFN